MIALRPSSDRGETIWVLLAPAEGGPAQRQLGVRLGERSTRLRVCGRPMWRRGVFADSCSQPPRSSGKVGCDAGLRSAMGFGPKLLGARRKAPARVSLAEGADGSFECSGCDGTVHVWCCLADLGRPRREDRSFGAPEKGVPTAHRQKTKPGRGSPGPGGRLARPTSVGLGSEVKGGDG